MLRRASTLLGLLLLAGAAGAAEGPTALRGMRAEVAALLVQGVAGGSLPVAAAVFPRAGGTAGDAGGLGFLLELPAAPPAASGEEHPLEVYAYAVDEAGAVAAHLAVTVPHWPSEGDGLKIVGRLETPPTALSMRFLVWDPSSRKFGLVSREVGASQGSAVPRIAESCPGWIVSGADPSGLAGLSARPVLVGGERQRLSLAAPPQAVGWRIRLAARGGDGTIEETTASSPAPGQLEFLVPELPDGVYFLSVVPAGEPPETPPVELESWLVSRLPPAAGGCARSWSRILEQARSGGAGAASETAPQEVAESQPSKQLAFEYEQLLERLATSGELTAAARELAALEVPIGQAELARYRLLFATEHQVARELGERDPRVLLPLVALHAETYRVHHGAGRFPLATHSRRLAVAIAELAADLVEAPAEKALVAVAITGLADLVETRHASLEAQRLLERALDLDESLEAARLLLAVSYERRGRYQDARQQLELLVTTNSAHYEARVRLAILLRRIGDAAGAERLLRAVVAERPPPWLLSLAYQTLAQLLIRDARLDEALAVIEEGRRRLPEEQVLQVLEAYALDRSGERQAMQRTLAGLRPSEAAQTPRYRYSDEPAAELDLLRETLRQSITVRLPVLSLALGLEGRGDTAP